MERRQLRKKERYGTIYIYILFRCVLSFSATLSKLDLPTLRKGSIEERPQRNKMKNLTLSRTGTQVPGVSLNFAESCQNLTYQRFTRVAEKKERNRTNKKYDARWDSNQRPRLVAPMLYTLSYSVS